MAVSDEYSWLFTDDDLRHALSDVGVYATNYETGEAFPSSVWRELVGQFGVTPGTDDYLRLVHPDDEPRVRHSLERLLSGEALAFRETFRISRPGGGFRWIRSHGRAMTLSENGTPRIFIGADWDITDLKDVESQLLDANRKERQRAEEVESLRQVAAAIGASLDLRETVHRILDETRRVIPYDTATVQILDGSFLRIIGSAGFSDLERVMKLRFPYPEENSISTRAIQEQRPFLTNDVLNEFPAFVQPDPQTTIQSWIGIPLVRRGEVIGLMALDSLELGAYNDRHLELANLVAGHIAVALENARLHEEAYALAMTDALTGVGSRHRFQVEGRLLFETAKRAQSAISVAMIDIDHFKVVNDTFGHDVGDVVLQRVAKAAYRQLRTTDLLARYGGEEFIILFPQTGTAEAYAAVERIRADVKAMVHEEMGRSVTVSAGVFEAVPTQNESLAFFVGRADEALYASKELGRDRATTWSPPVLEG